MSTEVGETIRTTAGAVTRSSDTKQRAVVPGDIHLGDVARGDVAAPRAPAPSDRSRRSRLVTLIDSDLTIQVDQPVSDVEDRDRARL